MPDDDSGRVAPIAEDGEYTPVLQGGDYTSLSWDGYGNLWVVEDLSAEVAEAEREEDLADDTEPGDTAVGSTERRETDRGEKRQVTRLWRLAEAADPAVVPEPARARVLVARPPG